MAAPLNGILSRSDELARHLGLAFHLAPFESLPRFEMAVLAAALAIEHREGVRRLLASGLGVTAAVVLRAQYEAVLRSVWICYVATDHEVKLLGQDISAETEREGKGLPMASEMLQGIARAAPIAASHPLENFRKQSWSALNSFVHSGVHAINRHRDGLPMQLAEDALRSSNGLCLLAAMQCAVATGSQDLVHRVGLAQRTFEDCLPKLDG